MADDRERQEEDLVDHEAGREGVRGAGQGVLVDEVVEQGAGAGVGLGGERDVAFGGGDRAGVVVGEIEQDGFGVGVGGIDRGLVGDVADLVTLALALDEEDDAHGEDGGDQAPEDDAHAAGRHGSGLRGADGRLTGDVGGFRREGFRCGAGEVDGRGQARRGLHGVFPDDERAGEGGGDAFLVAGVVDAGRAFRFSGASSSTRAGQVSESTGRTEAVLASRGMPERPSAALRPPSRAWLAGIQAAWPVSQGTR